MNSFSRRLKASCRADDIVRAALDADPPFNGSICKFVHDHGGKDYLNQRIAPIVGKPNRRPGDAIARLIGIAVTSWAEPDADLSLALLTRLNYEDFFAYMPEHKYIFVPTRALWPAASVNARLPAKLCFGMDNL
jgi:hypothetical protein